MNKEKRCKTKRRHTKRKNLEERKEKERQIWRGREREMSYKTRAKRVRKEKREKK
jgi:hypothetical protein